MRTIATVSTPVGSGAIGIIRMSGDRSLEIASKLFTPLQKGLNFKDAIPNTMYLGIFSHNNFSDKVMAVYFKAPRSYTGEDLIEFQCHGGMRIVQEVLNACLACGANSADKGEFTKRAFLNGKLALSDAEGIIDMINGESLASINAAFRLSTGEVATQVNKLESKLLDAISYLEASLDYPDEMADESVVNASTVIDESLSVIKKLKESYNGGKYIKNGINVALVGIANVGKSSLLNALLEKDRAIVTDIAGTTRDTLEERLEVDGIMLNLVDTAGIRETSDTIEKMGVERSRSIAKSSDLVLFISEADRQLNDDEKSLLSSIDAQVLMVYNKSDKPIDDENKDKGIFISCKTGEGIQALKNTIVNSLVDNNIDAGGTLITSSRHYDALNRAYLSLVNAKRLVDEQPIELTLIDLREAYFALGEITGDTVGEDIINRVFEKFCVGK